MPNYVAYSRTTGSLEFGHVTGTTGRPFEDYGAGKEDPGATHLIGYRGPAWSYALLDDKATGRGVVYEVEPI